VGEGDVRPGFDRLPGPLGQQPAGGQPAHALALILHRDIRHIDARQVTVALLWFESFTYIAGL
jgi:hypothetical protein